jgi:hypothetical protein
MPLSALSSNNFTHANVNKIGAVGATISYPGGGDVVYTFSGTGGSISFNNNINTRILMVGGGAEAESMEVEVVEVAVF